jgi:hypothetical protein
MPGKDFMVLFECLWWCEGQATYLDIECWEAVVEKKGFGLLYLCCWLGSTGKWAC